MVTPCGSRDTLCMAKTAKAPHFIRQWRKHRGLTLEALAERVHMTHGNLSRIERGEVPYNQVLLERLAEELRCEPADLIVRDPSDPGGLWSIWDRLTPPQREQGAGLLRVIAGAKTGTDD
jgi:transcriptional regulator with XRE-family HTH domain